MHDGTLKVSSQLTPQTFSANDSSPAAKAFSGFGERNNKPDEKRIQYYGWKYSQLILGQKGTQPGTVLSQA